MPEWVLRPLGLPVITLLDTSFRAGAVSLIALVVLLISRGRATRTATVSASAFAVGLIAYLLCSAPFWSEIPARAQAGLMVGCLANPFLFWLLARAIFVEGFALRIWHAVALAGMEVLGFLAISGGQWIERTRGIVGVGAVAAMAFKIVSIGFLITALVTAYRGRASDLVERRRVFRVVFVTTTAGYMILVQLVEIMLQGKAPHPMAATLNSAVIFALAFGVAAMLLSPKFDFFLQPIQPASPETAMTTSERAVLQRLQESITAGVYRHEGLTIGQFALTLHTQEHRLRALINTKLGFRNFNEFLNQHRIADARRDLADPAKANLPILTIALSLGYGSIGPFNRAFKLATAETPSEYRRRVLAKTANESGVSST